MHTNHDFDIEFDDSFGMGPSDSGPAMSSGLNKQRYITRVARTVNS